MSGGPQFVPGRDLCNQILTSRPNPTVMASVEPVDPALCGMCDGDGVVCRDFGVQSYNAPMIVVCPACDGTGLDGAS